MSEEFSEEFDAEGALERHIHAAWCSILRSASEADQRKAFEEMRRLIALRSPAQVQRMERERGLR